jgi:hypothetical protein|tara:strand:- start:256 stop:534 length:279 start_codon:yes stop_codon:yes gene_type:complete
LTQNIDKEIKGKKRSMIEREIKMYVISHHLFKSDDWLRKCPWTENFPVDQLVDDDNKLLKFETQEEALDTMRSWGVDVNTALENGVKIERVH